MITRSLLARKRLTPLIRLALGAPFTLVSVAALADTGPACQQGGSTACQIIYTQGAVGHGDTGKSGQPIVSTFTDPRTLTAVDGPQGWGAVQLETIAGAGGDADSDGQNGGAGGAGATVSATVGPGVAANGANSGGILRFQSAGGDGGGGQGDHVGSPGTSGAGGAGGEIDVTMNGSVLSTAPDSPGLFVQSTGGSSKQGDAGKVDFYGAESGAGGAAGPVNVTIGGTITTVSTGALIMGVGGAGGNGADDSSTAETAAGRNGGNGGSSSQAVQATVSGSVQSSIGSGIVVQAAGGTGGTGGNAAQAGSSEAGNGGAGGTAGLASLDITGQVTGGQAGSATTVYGAFVQSVGGDGGTGGTSTGGGGAGGSHGGNGGQGGDSAGGAGLVLRSGASAFGGDVVLSAVSGGGNGGAGGNADGELAHGGAGGTGGNGGSASMLIAGSVTGAAGAPAIGVQAVSYGGSGGAGAAATGVTYDYGATGGTGGTGGTASLTLQAGGSVSTYGSDATPAAVTSVLPGVLVRSNGGIGGAGGKAENGMGTQAGDAGAGGAGGNALAAIDGSVSTSGSYAYGVLVQSIGGAGAGGGDAKGVLVSRGGPARNGGAGDAVYLAGSGGTVTTTGTGAIGMAAQSVGGGGGVGGNASALGGSAAIGGNGGAGGDGGNVTVGLSGDSNSALLNDVVVTRGDSALGLLGQSVGGAGGNGGNALTIGSELPALAIGGDGKSGGTGGTVNVRNDGLVTTFGPQSGGIAAQSVGGGGGNGGAGVAINAGVQISTAFALGGAGASGGTGGAVTLNNNGQVSTYGADAYGLKAQSVSGGGGQGGTALATAIALGGDPEVPTTSVSVTVGGSGGAGGDQSASPVTLNNHGLVTTAGDGAIGILAQNIAGGGGNGGDSTAASYANAGDKENTSITVSSSIGGKGGGGGTAGSVTVTNDGLVATMGADAYGVFAHSVAGGGGVGGTGDASASAGKGDNSYGGSLTVGGSGGQGGSGGAVTITTTAQGNVATSGDGANALFAQSVGGGGGASGGGTAKANGGAISLAVTVGGNAGKGGTGGTVNVTNNANLLTTGADADAVFAQSIGGGGGKAGKGASTAGGAQSPQQAIDDMSGTIANGLGLDPQGVTKIADGVYKVGDKVWQGIHSVADLQTVLGGGSTASLRDDDDDDGTASSIKLSATIGGQGGTGGNGNTVTIANAGSILTTGPKSDGIFAQSVGQGGGVGGATSFSGSTSSGGSDDGQTSGSLKVGASGAGAGAGGSVQVGNTGLIAVEGVGSSGINAQSVGGGGGKGAATASSSGALKDFNLTLGGSGGAGGAGSDVTVTNDGSITTAERQSVAILAQSVGGGGGTAHLLSSNVTASDADNSMKISATIGGSGGAAGDGGNTTVAIGKNATGTIRTAGAGGIGVVAQSIGGGGGMLVTTSAQADAQGGGNGGGIQDGTTIPITIGDAAGSSGNGGTVNVTLGAGSTGSASSIMTSKANAYGILAQSVGGGGGLFAGATPSTELAKLYAGTNQTGNGGNVSVLLDQGGWIQTGGAGSVGVFAQSVGGGGGVIGGMQNVNLASGLQTNPTAESGQGGNVSVDLENGSSIVTTGAGAHGILAQALGGGGGVVAGADNTGYAYAGANPYTGCSGDACTGNVSVTMGNGTVVRTSGAGAWGIYAQSRANGTNNATVSIGSGASVESEGKSAGGIYLEAAGSNTVANAGSIAATSAGLAVGSASGNTLVHNESTGVITGSIDLTIGSGTGSVQNDSGGKINSGATLGAASMRNDGTLEIGGAGAPGARTELTGNLVQGGSGRIVIDSDHAAGVSDRLTVDGNASLAGQLQVRPTTLTPATVQVMDVKGSLDASQLQAANPMLVNYRLSTGATTGADGSAQQSLFVTPQGRFAAASAGLGSNAQSVAQHLQANFDAGSGGLATVMAQLANNVQDPLTYKATLTSLGNETQQAVGVSRLAASHAFVDRMNSCPEFDGSAGTQMHERECLWGRAIDNRTTAGGGDRASYSVGTHSVQFGGQRQIAPGWFLGGSAAYDSESWNSSTGAGSVSGNGAMAGLVLKHEVGNWTFSGAVDVGRGSYDTQRNIVFPGYSAQATGSFDLTQAGLHSRIAYLIPQSNWYLKPYLDLETVHLHTSGYTEQGAGPLGLNVSGNSDTLFTASPMLEVGGRFELDNGMTLRPFAALGASFHDKNRWGASAQLEGAAPGVAPFATASTAPTSLANVRLGVNVTIRKNLELRAEYAGQFGSGYRSNEGVLRVNYLF